MARTRTTKKTARVNPWGEAWPSKLPEYLQASSLDGAFHKATPERFSVRAPCRSVHNPPYYPFPSRGERTRFLEALHDTLPLEIRNLIYTEFLDRSEMQVVMLPKTLNTKQKQPSLRSSWEPLNRIGPVGSIMRDELVRVFYEKTAICILHPHIGHLDLFLSKDILFGTNVVPKCHLRNIILDVNKIDMKSIDGNRWASAISSLRKPSRYNDMLAFPEKLLWLGRELEGRASACVITISFGTSIDRNEEWSNCAIVDYVKFLENGVQAMRGAGVTVALVRRMEVEVRSPRHMVRVRHLFQRIDISIENTSEGNRVDAGLGDEELEWCGGFWDGIH